jgi:hypothetical protein
MNGRITTAALIIALGIAGMSLPLSGVSARQAEAIRIDSDDIAGVVRSSKGPEAGVWVIAETFDLPTGFRKIVVTDDRGRYVLPDLPKANYTIWVRGYGLVDSQRVKSVPGKTLNLTAVIAPNPRAAAEYYPAQYWYSLVQPPPPSEFPGTGQGPKGNGIDQRMRNQQQYLGEMRNRTCGQCHQIGSKHTREMPQNMGTFDSAFAAWERRVRRGQWGPQMDNYVASMGKRRTLQMYSDWTDRIMAGELPPVPPRPQGIERNLVITQWDWAKDTSYVHDNASTDVRNPTVNAYGRIYGSEEFASENIHILDPKTHTYIAKRLSWIGDYEKIPFGLPQSVAVPQRLYGDEVVWTARVSTHFPIMDQAGRTWFVAHIRSAADTPAYCSSPEQPSAKLLPIKRSAAGFALYDPKTDSLTAIPLCGAGGHANFAWDADNTLWTATTNWFNTAVWDKTHDPAKAEGWTALVADTNGNGKRDEYVDVDAPLDPTKDHEIQGGSYGVTPSPTDGSVWGTQNEYPGGVSHLIPGGHPPETALAEFFAFPLIDPARPQLGYKGYDPRGINVDRNGVVWMSLSMGAIASFDRRKCKEPAPIRGPKALDPQACADAWTIIQSPGPNFKGVTDTGSADFHYWSVVDKFGYSGLGENIPLMNGGNSDSLLALVDGKWVILRVPYPMGFFSKGIDGRIDDPKGDWKGRGIWASVNSFAAFHQEGGKSQRSKLEHFQLRPNPLAH